MLAMLAAGYMSKQGGIRAGQAASTGDGGGLGGMLGKITGQSNAQAGTRSSGGIVSMLDLDGDGNPLDDIIGMAGRFLR